MHFTISVVLCLLSSFVLPLLVGDGEDDEGDKDEEEDKEGEEEDKEEREEREEEEEVEEGEQVSRRGRRKRTTMQREINRKVAVLKSPHQRRKKHNFTVKNREGIRRG